MNLRPKKNQAISGWGNYPCFISDLYRPEKLSDFKRLSFPAVPRGLGRSYGDAAVLSGATISMEKMNRLLDFNEKTGILRAEAGISIGEIIDIFAPRGWFIPVTPGTKHATLGGCIACDVHGKNYHRRGAFSNYINSFSLLLANGGRIHCSPEHEKDLFFASVGGMGLTGIIIEASIQLLPIESLYLNVRTETAPNLEASLAFFSGLGREDDYSVAWIDCLSLKKRGRGVVMNAHHAAREEVAGCKQKILKPPNKREHNIPPGLASPFLNSTVLRWFNRCYYYIQSQNQGPHIQHYNSYFYPLDCIPNWNRFYGTKGFIQYQFVVPEHHAENVIVRVLERLDREKSAPFLAVLKRFDQEGKGLLSFPKKGMTVALDMPMHSFIPRTLRELDEIVLNHQGRVYLAKDACLSPESFRAMYPKFPEWLAVKNRVDPSWKFCSELSKRLQMEKAP